MNLEEIQNFCLSLPSATEDVKWGNDLAFCIAKKMFCVCSLEGAFSVSLKVTSEEFDELSISEGVMPAQYVARYKWITILESTRFSNAEWKHFIKQSYELVLAKLPKKLRDEILAVCV